MAKKDENETGTEREEGARDFGIFMRGLNDGRFNGECAAELQELVRALRKHAQDTNGKAKGKLTLSLSFHYEGGHVSVTPNVTQTRPPSVRGMTWMFMTKGDNLSLEQERQTSLPIREVKAPEAKAIAPAPTAAPKSV